MNDEPTPADFSTSTVWPWCDELARPPPGVMADAELVVLDLLGDSDDHVRTPSLSSESFRPAVARVRACRDRSPGSKPRLVYRSADARKRCRRLPYCVRLGSRARSLAVGRCSRAAISRGIRRQEERGIVARPRPMVVTVDAAQCPAATPRRHIARASCRVPHAASLERASTPSRRSTGSAGTATIAGASATRASAVSVWWLTPRCRSRASANETRSTAIGRAAERARPR